MRSLWGERLILRPAAVYGSEKPDIVAKIKKQRIIPSEAKRSPLVPIDGHPHIQHLPQRQEESVLFCSNAANSLTPGLLIS